MIPVGTRVVIGRGDGPVNVLPSAPRPLLALPQPGGVRTLGDCLQGTHTDAFVVLHHGELATEWYREPEVQVQPQALMSVTKSVVGCLAGILANRGVVDFDGRVDELVPEVDTGGYADARVRDVLDMRTGGDYVEDHDDPASEVAAIRRTMLEPGPGVPTLHQLVATTPRVALPGGPFAYRSLDSEVLGWALERAAGRPVLDLLADLLLARLGLEQPAVMGLDGEGNPHAGGGLALAPRDLARFGQMLLHGGAVGADVVVPTAFLKDTRVGGSDSREAFVAGASRIADHPGAISTIYRNQFWVLEQGGRQLLGIGIHGQLLYVDSDNDTVVVKLSSWPTPRDPEAFTAGLECAVSVAESLGGRPRPRPSPIA